MLHLFAFYKLITFFCFNTFLLIILHYPLNQISLTHLSRQWLIWMILTSMLQTGTWLSEGLITVVTLVRTTTSVSTDMANQGKLNREGLATNVTFIWT